MVVNRHCEPFDKLRVVSQSNQSEILSDEAIYDRDAELIGGTEIASSLKVLLLAMTAQRIKAGLNTKPGFSNSVIYNLQEAIK